MKEIEPQLPEAHHVVFTPDQERRLWRKIDLRIVPIISLMYLCCSVDRGMSMRYHFQFVYRTIFNGIDR